MRKTKQAVILLLLLLNFACASKAQPERAALEPSAAPAVPRIAYLIPKDYTGGIVILFNQINSA